MRAINNAEVYVVFFFFIKLHPFVSELFFLHSDGKLLEFKKSLYWDTTSWFYSKQIAQGNLRSILHDHKWLFLYGQAY